MGIGLQDLAGFTATVPQFAGMLGNTLLYGMYYVVCIT
jgi:hypothetical protein